jgi:hypothetical protein
MPFRTLYAAGGHRLENGRFRFPMRPATPCVWRALSCVGTVLSVDWLA